MTLTVGNSADPLVALYAATARQRGCDLDQGRSEVDVQQTREHEALRHRQEALQAQRRARTEATHGFWADVLGVAADVAKWSARATTFATGAALASTGALAPAGVAAMAGSAGGALLDEGPFGKPLAQAGRWVEMGSAVVAGVTGLVAHGASQGVAQVARASQAAAATTLGASSMARGTAHVAVTRLERRGLLAEIQASSARAEGDRARQRIQDTTGDLKAQARSLQRSLTITVETLRLRDAACAAALRRGA